MPNYVSVIIPTKNRPIDLDLTVESIFRQTVLPVQLIIVDQSENNESKERVERLFAETSSTVREKVQLCYILDGAITGLTMARNRAMEIAQGAIWLFLDDDVDLKERFVEEIIAVYQRLPDVSGVSGVVTNYPFPPLSYRLWASIFACGPFHDERQPIYWNANQNQDPEPVAVRKFGGGLMSFRANAIQGHRFDENLTGVSDGEDVDFCARLGRKAMLVIAPRARLEHKASPIGRETAHWLRRNARASHYLYWKNWNRGIWNRLCFMWLNVGYALVATYAALRRFSPKPWHALRMGIDDAKAVHRN